MASPEEVVPSLPDTLPEDFSEWDGQAAPPALPVNSREWEAWAASHSLAKPPKSVSHPPERKASAAPVADRPRDKRPAPSAPAPVQRPQKDFDLEPASVPLRVNSNEWEAWAASFGKPGKPPAHSGDREAVLSPAVAKPRDTRRGSSSPSTPKQQAPASELVGESPNHASAGLEASHAASHVAVAVIEPEAAVVEEVESSPEAAPTLTPHADEALFQGFSSKNLETVEEPAISGKKKKQIIVAAAGACVVLPLLMIPFFHHGAKAATKPSVETLSTATVTETQTDAPNPPASAPSTPDKPPAAAATQQAPDSKPANDEKATNSAPAPTKAAAQLMDAQLAEPTRIPQAADKQVAENAPPPASFGTAGAEGLGANDSLFNGHAQPVVKAALSRPLAISSGVATGMLIQRTPPIYPTIAKSARVSGTVELHAIIAKDGTIRDLRLVSGPEMLRQAAMDAVRTWRYRPYKLDNQPTEVETTINVVFTLGN